MTAALWKEGMNIPRCLELHALDVLPIVCELLRHNKLRANVHIVHRAIVMVVMVMCDQEMCHRAVERLLHPLDHEQALLWRCISHQYGIIHNGDSRCVNCVVREDEMVKVGQAVDGLGDIQCRQGARVWSGVVPVL